MTDTTGNGQRPDDGAVTTRHHSAGRKRNSELLATFGHALGILFFIPRPWIGALLWAALLINPRHAIFAVLGLIIGEATRRALKADDIVRLGGDLKANALLAAVSVSWLTMAVPDLSLTKQVLLASVAALSTAILATVLQRLLSKSGLPALVWPYCLVGALLFSLFPEWAVLSAQATAPWAVPDHAIQWAQSFLRSLSSILFSHTFVTGIIVGCAILIWSRVMFLAGLVGWLSGAGVLMLCNAMGLAFVWLPLSYNFLLSGMALGAVFFVPGRAASLVAGLAGALAALISMLLLHFLDGGAAAYLPISACLTIWLGISALTHTGGQSIIWRNHKTWLPPELAWWQTAHWIKRFGNDEPLLVVPVSGPVIVTQSFDGTLSHVGEWRHALDFQRPETPQSDASIWNAPVTPPGPGTVVRARGNVPDNQVGVSNFAENWGNHYVIHLDSGNYAMLAHLQQGTLALTTGQHVEIGTHLGNVGNSGRSPIPHLHLQAQASPEPGAPTIPFRIANFQSAERPDEPLLHWNDARVPAESEIVMASYPNPAAHSVLTSLSPGSAVWTAERKGDIPAAFKPPAQMHTERMGTLLDEAGNHIFRSARHGSLLTAMAPDAWRIIEARKVRSPLLRLLCLAVPAIPYAVTKGMTWDDDALLGPAGPHSWLSLMIAPYQREPFAAIRCKCLAEPTDANSLITVEATIENGSRELPSSLTCDYQMLRGPVRVSAEFESGSVTFSQLSFTPGMPLGDAPQA